MDILRTAAEFFKEHYKGLTPEAVAAFLLICSDENSTVISLGSDLRIGGGELIDHLNMMMGGVGAGLIGVRTTSEGTQFVELTAIGREARAKLIKEYDKTE